MDDEVGVYVVYVVYMDNVVSVAWITSVVPVWEKKQQVWVHGIHVGALEGSGVRPCQPRRFLQPL